MRCGSHISVWLAVLGVSLARAAPASPHPAPPDSIVIDERSDRDTITVHRGDRIVIRLAAQLGTGYSWHISRRDSSRLTLLHEPVVESPDTARPGGAEYQVFRMRATRRGVTTLRLEYARPWEVGQVALKRLGVVIRAR